jgi:hypothetical protein
MEQVMTVCRRPGAYTRPALWARLSWYLRQMDQISGA